ncbi:MAG: oligosaccharide flippase family protein [Planctomycetota bacterium]|nr:oligosaccharide flippase family protein [Planctomycetota bacterium]
MNTTCHPPLIAESTPSESSDDGLDVLTDTLNPDATGPNPEDLQSLKRDGFAASVSLLIVLTVIQKALGFLRSIVICRKLEPEQLGLWSMALTFMETFGPLLILSIPACFGRYFEHFESRRQLRSFIRQAVILIGLCFPIGIVLLGLFREPLTRLIFGGPEHVNMLMTSLLIVIPFSVFGVLTNMLTGLRKSQTRSLGEFINGISFTALAIGLVLFGKANAFSIAYAFAGSYAIASFFSLVRFRRIYRELRPDCGKLPWGGTWKKLAPVIFVFWLSDFLTNLFFTVDRYMIINLSAVEFGEPLYQVGNYEAAHVMPLLFSSFMALVANVLLPYLSRDWEAGDRQTVANRVNLSVKLGGVLLIVGSVCFLWLSESLFEILFRGKYGSGLAVLPCITFFYVGSGMSFLFTEFLLVQ